MIYGLFTTLGILATGAAGACEALDRDVLVRGDDTHSVDLSEYGPPAGARPPSHRFEGRLHLSGQPSTRTLLALDDFLGAGDAALARTLPQDLDVAFVPDGAVLVPARRGPIPRRSEERRVGAECVRKSRSRWSPYN